MGSLRENSYQSATGIQELTQHSQMLNDWSLSYQQISKGRFSGDLHELHLDGIQIFKEKITESVFQQGDSQPDSLCFGVFEHLSGDARWLGEPINLNDLTFTHNGGELMLKTPKHSSLCGVSIPNELIHDLIDETALSKINSIKNSAFSTQVRQQIDYMLTGLIQHPISATNQHARRQFHSDIRGLVSNFANLLNGNEPAQQHINRTKFIIKARRTVAMLHEAIIENRDKSLTIDDLCKISFTSRRGLHNCFIAVTGQSPAAFLKIVRLNGVKQALVNGDRETVSEVAMDWGFWHLSQFTQDYKKMFAELPSQTQQFNYYTKQ